LNFFELFARVADLTGGELACDDDEVAEILGSAAVSEIEGTGAAAAREDEDEEEEAYDDDEEDASGLTSSTSILVPDISIESNDWHDASQLL